jgi:hypothetical protein
MFAVTTSAQQLLKEYTLNFLCNSYKPNALQMPHLHQKIAKQYGP